MNTKKIKMPLSLVIVGFSLVVSSIGFAGQPTINSDSFREIFRQNLKDSGAGSLANSAQFDHLIYSPSAKMLEMTGQTSAEKIIQSLTSTYTQFNPSDLQKLGEQRSKSIGGSQISSQKINDALRKNPLTIVLVPGIFGEFIDTPIFKELMQNQNSAQKKLWLEKSKGLMDSHFSTDQYGAAVSAENSLKHVPLSDLVSVSSIDDSNSKPLVKVVLFMTPVLSLESVSNIAEVSRTFTRRLEAYFKVMGVPENLAFLGYSRGGMIGLDMLAQANAKQKSGQSVAWLPKVRGMVAVGGVTYGSDLADQLDNPDMIITQQLNAVKKLAQSLELTTSNPIEYSRVLAANMLRWTQFKAEMGFIASKQFAGLLTADQEILKKLESVKNYVGDQLTATQGTDIKSAIELVSQLASKFGLIRDTDSCTSVWNALGCASNVIQRLAFNEYNDNIARFKKVVHEVDVAVYQLTTRERLEWWRQNVVPVKGIRYYAVTGTLSDERSELAADREVAVNQIGCYQPKATDYKGLIQNYRQLRDLLDKKGTLNDSQVAVHKVKFSEELSRNLNQENAGMQTRLLAILGAHHWAMALQTVAHMEDGSVNPFPRTALLKSIAASIALDQP